MAYENSKPQATDRLSASQGDILSNFSYLDTTWKLNHVDFNLPDSGKHHFLTMPNQVYGAGFPLETLATEIGLYAQGDNLYFRPPSQVAGVHTNDQKLNMDTVTGVTDSITFPGGFIQKWGYANVNMGNSTITFPVAFPHLCFNVQVTTVNAAYGTNNFVNVHTLTAASVGCTSSSRSGAASNSAIYWFAVGY
jgi:hypothetical protein